MLYTKTFENRQSNTLRGDAEAAVLTLRGLHHHRRWCAWQVEMREGRNGKQKPCKVPYGLNQQGYKSNDPATWVSFDHAHKLLNVLWKPTGVGGVGISLGVLQEIGEGYALIGFDLDSCIDAGSGGGGASDWAVEVLDALGDVYWEISPSGTGLKVFTLARVETLSAMREALGILRWKRSWKAVAAGREGGNDHAAGIEAHTGNHYFTVTGTGEGALGLIGVSEAEAVRAIAERVFGVGADGEGGRVTGGSAGGDVEVTDAMIRDVGALLPDGLEALNAAEQGLLERLPRVKALWTQTFALGADKTRSTAAWRLGGELRRAGVEAEVGIPLMLKCPWVWDRFMEMDEWQGRRQVARDWYRHGVGEVGSGGGGLGAMNIPRAGKASDTGDSRGPRDTAEEDGAEHDQAETNGTENEQGKPEIEVHAGINEVVDVAERVLETCGVNVFQRGGRLVRPYALEMDTFNGDKTLVPGFDSLTTHSAIDILASTADWTRWDARAKGPVRTMPSELIANIWLSRRGSWKARRVKGIITSPTIRPDGSLITAAGYDPVTRLFMMIDPGLRMPGDGRWNGERLVKADAEEALVLLEGLLEDFPFVGAADYSVGLSALLMPVVRGALDKRPLHVFDAPNPGTGKTYLVEICTALSLGQSAPVSSWSLDEGENEKRLSSLLLSGTPVGILDNINGVLSSDLLCQSLDQSTLRIRVFGKLEHRDIENNICLYATGNNIVVSGDLVRRALVSKLDAQMERPEIRSFHGDPLQRVQRERGRYLAAALTVVRAHMQAGYPGCEGMQPMASFENWGKLVRGALRWLGRTDPVETAERTFREDPKRADLRDFIEAWVRRYGYEGRSVREALDMLSQVGGDNKPLPDTIFSRSSEAMTGSEVVSMFRDVALRIAGRNDVVDAKLLGNWLKRNKGGVVNRHRFVLGQAEGKNKTQRWSVEKVFSPLAAVEEKP